MHAYSGFGQGYVQDVFAKVWAPSGRPHQCCMSVLLDAWVVRHYGAQDDHLSFGSSSGIILCGQKEMNEAVTNLVTGKGVTKESIITNF